MEKQCRKLDCKVYTHNTNSEVYVFDIRTEFICIVIIVMIFCSVFKISSNSASKYCFKTRNLKLNFKTVSDTVTRYF